MMVKALEVSVVVPREHHLNSKKRQLVPAAVLGGSSRRKGYELNQQRWQQ